VPQRWSRLLTRWPLPATLHDPRKGDAHMPASVSDPPDTIDWLDGSTEIELSARDLRAYWDADIIDVDDKNKYDKIIERKDPFEVRFRVYLKGRLWRCICGHWCFNVGFTAIGKGEDFNLSDVLSDPSVLHFRNRKGRDGGNTN